MLKEHLICSEWLCLHFVSLSNQYTIYKVFF
uniref:Uncharacterized protein n=1 Tax=Moniliophthora roreri TaxID=221103 RepID=A0A0W0FMV3_MONRR